MKIPLVDLKAWYNTIRGEVGTASQRVVQQEQFIRGPDVQPFEEELAAYYGTRFAIGAASGTDALHFHCHCRNRHPKNCR